MQWASLMNVKLCVLLLLLLVVACCAAMQRLGGLYDGVWFTDSLVCDNTDWEAIMRLGI